MQSGQTKKIKDKNKKIKNTMKVCKFFYCNDGCKGTTVESGKNYPKLKENMYIHLDKKQAKKFRKKLFKNKTDILVDNVPYNMPLEIKKRYLDRGALSICEPYIKDGSLDITSSKIF